MNAPTCAKYNVKAAQQLSHLMLCENAAWTRAVPLGTCREEKSTEHVILKRAPIMLGMSMRCSLHILLHKHSKYSSRGGMTFSASYEQEILSVHSRTKYICCIALIVLPSIGTLIGPLRIWLRRNLTFIGSQYLATLLLLEHYLKTVPHN